VTGSKVRPDEVDELAVAVAAAREGDDDAFRRVYRAVQPRLLRYLRGLVGDGAEDVASEAWLQIARDLDSFHGNGVGFRAWATTIARSRALDHLRHSRRRPALAVAPEDMADRASDHDTEASALATMSTEAALALIAELPRDQAEAVLLRTVMGLDAKSAATVLGKRAGAVRTAAYRGLRKLATRLESMQDLPPRPADTTPHNATEMMSPRISSTPDQTRHLTPDATRHVTRTSAATVKRTR
jgi:RNA polymerase sigma-70 factor, ECF subfamily